MGHWSEICGISGLPIISNVKIGMIILRKNKYESLNKGPFYYNDIVTLPIFGQYGDYGNIENIEKNKNTKILEKYFKASIQEIADALQNIDRKDPIKNKKLYEKIKNFSYMYIRKEVYDEFIKLHYENEEEVYDSNIAYYNANLDTIMLKELGFKFIKTNNKKERYIHLYQNPKFKNVDIWSDNFYIKAKYKKEENKHNEYSPKDLEKWLCKKGFKADFSYLKKVSVALFHIKKIRKKILEIDICIKKLKETKRNKSKKLQYKRVALKFKLISNYIFIKYPFGDQLSYIQNPLTVIYKNAFLNKKIDQELINWWNFVRCCSSIGIQFKRIQPTGVQDGDYRTMKRLGIIIINICDEYYKENY